MEKPFLEHLEDLRIMITRVVITLIIAMVACFTFQKQVMDVLRKPVEDVWAVKLSEKLPADFSAEEWEDAKAVEKAAFTLEPSERAAFLQQVGDDRLFNVACVRLVRAANRLEGAKQIAFLDQATLGNEKLRAEVDALLVKGADPEGQNKSDLRTQSTLQPTEGFMLSMKLAFFSGIIVSFPLLLLYIFQFILPGLHDEEKKMLWPAMAIGFGLFLAGVLFAYFLVLPRALVFFASWDESLGISSDWRIGWYISFATQFTLLFGLSFELPVVVMVFVKLGLLSYEMMHRTRSYAVLAIVVVAAIITPTSDILTLSLMAVPMYVLYETCIWLAYFDEKKKRRAQEEEDKNHLNRLLSDHVAEPSHEDIATDDDHDEPQDFDQNATEEDNLADDEGELADEEDKLADGDGEIAEDADPSNGPSPWDDYENPSVDPDEHRKDD